MKKKFLSLFVALSFIGFLSAQKSVVKTNPIGLAFGNLNAKYETALNSKTSILVGANYFYKLFGVSVNSFGLDGEYRFFFTNKKKNVPEGFYIGPSVGVNFINQKDIDYSATSLGIGATLGYQWIWDSGFVLDLGLGPQYTTVLSESGTSTTSFSGVLPRLSFAIGYAF